MPAHTEQDFANMLTGSDFTTAVYPAGGGLELFGILTRGGAGALDINDRRLRLLLIREDADQVPTDSVITVESVNYTVREREPGDRGVTLVLETT